MLVLAIFLLRKSGRILSPKDAASFTAKPPSLTFFGALNYTQALPRGRRQALYKPAVFCYHIRDDILFSLISGMVFPPFGGAELDEPGEQKEAQLYGRVEHKHHRQ